MLIDTPKRLLSTSCSRCWRTQDRCQCREIHPVANRLRILLLQHPQEALEQRSTGRLVSLSLGNCVHRIGLSWPSLKAALGDQASPASWGVLYVGGLQSSESEQISPSSLHGLVVLDGTWKQSKTLWWRNPWLMRLKRVRLAVDKTSSYFPLRKEPRKECLSSLEAVAECFERSGEIQVSENLGRVFREFLSRPAISKPARTSAEPPSANSPKS